jgi:hypothetical protein
MTKHFSSLASALVARRAIVVWMVSLVGPVAAFAAVTFTQLQPIDTPCNPAFGGWYQGELLSPDGTLVVGRLRCELAGPPLSEFSGSGVRWTLADGWTQSSSVGVFDDFATELFGFWGISSDDVVGYSQYDNSTNSNIVGVAPDGAPPGIGITAPAACPSYPTAPDYFTVSVFSKDGTTFAGDCPVGLITAKTTGETQLVAPHQPYPQKITSISDRGNVVVGDPTFSWSLATGYRSYSLSDPAIPTRVLVSGDGSTLTSVTGVSLSEIQAIVADVASGHVTFVDKNLKGPGSESIGGITYDGSLVVGSDGSQSPGTAFAWSAAGGFVELDVPSRPIAITPTGLVVGVLDPSTGDDVFVWNPRTGWFRTLESLLRDAGVAVPAGGLGAPIGISDDGRTIAGNLLPVFQDQRYTAEPWVATIDPPGFSCDVTMSQSSYTDGQQVVITSLRFTNNNTASTEARLRLQLTLPFGITANALDLGAGGGFFVPASFDKQLGPVTMFTLQPGQPRGSFQWRCALEDPHTGAVLAEDFAPFTFE